MNHNGPSSSVRFMIKILKLGLSLLQCRTRVYWRELLLLLLSVELRTEWEPFEILEDKSWF